MLEFVLMTVLVVAGELAVWMGIPALLKRLGR